MKRIILFALFYAIVPASAEPSWRSKQNVHELSVISDNGLESLCGLSNIERLQYYLQPLLTARVAGSRKIQRLGRRIQRDLEELGFAVEVDEFEDETPMGRKMFRNLIATWDPQAPRRLVLACHYDSKYFRDFVFIGATDSAVPCAMILDIVSSLAPFLSSGEEKDLTLQLLFFDGEEAFEHWTETDSLYGARHLANKWESTPFNTVRHLDRIDVLMLLDLLGSADPRIANFDMGAGHHFNSLADIERDMTRLNCLKRSSQGQIFRSDLVYRGSRVEDDHKPFWTKGVKILHVIPSPFPAVWHTRYDDSTALDWPSIHDLTAVVRVFVVKYLRLSTAHIRHTM